ncbi:hypothetical protein AA0472_0180 [Acetobacter estunensis NRIC 0472]|nr:hypothetical protein AA0472_0180 [Acetobacter estunensis NRIC 0472]
MSERGHPHPMARHRQRHMPESAIRPQPHAIMGDHHQLIGRLRGCKGAHIRQISMIADIDAREFSTRADIETRMATYVQKAVPVLSKCLHRRCAKPTLSIEQPHGLSGGRVSCAGSQQDTKCQSGNRKRCSLSTPCTPSLKTPRIIYMS